MKVVIIEDERLTAEDLKDVLHRVNPDIEITTTLTSVRESLEYFRKNPLPDLIFSDIQLGDGLSFDVFSELKIDVPIIFCTAFNEYAINAFKTNGIHYILKPFDEKSIREALEKYERLKSTMGRNDRLLKDLQQLLGRKETSSATSVLVHHRDKVIPVQLVNIALFYIKRGITHLYTFDGNTYFINKTLEELDQSAGNSFYRANRQFIVNRKAVESLSQRLSRKATLLLNVPFEETITISKEKVSGFLEWLEGN